MPGIVDTSALDITVQQATSISEALIERVINSPELVAYRF